MGSGKGDRGSKETKKPKKSNAKIASSSEFIETSFEPEVVKKGKKKS